MGTCAMCTLALNFKKKSCPNPLQGPRQELLDFEGSRCCIGCRGWSERLTAGPPMEGQGLKLVCCLGLLKGDMRCREVHLAPKRYLMKSEGEYMITPLWNATPQSCLFLNLSLAWPLLKGPQGHLQWVLTLLMRYSFKMMPGGEL